MRKCLALLLVLLSLPFSFARAEEISTELVLKMDYFIKLPDRLLFGYYTGETLNDVPHGYGVYDSWDSKKSYPFHYMGKWENGMICGYGGLYWDDGESIVGTFENNAMVSVRISKPDTAWLSITYKPNEHGCYNITEQLASRTTFQGCINPETGHYHLGTLVSPYGVIEITPETEDPDEILDSARVLVPVIESEADYTPAFPSIASTPKP